MENFSVPPCFFMLKSLSQHEPGYMLTSLVTMMTGETDKGGLKQSWTYEYIHIREKRNYLFWCKNRVKFLFLAHYLRGNISPFTFIIFTTLWFYLFWSKFSIQKMLKIAQNCHIMTILANLPHWMAYYGLIWQPRIHWRPNCGHLIQQVIIWEVKGDLMCLIVQITAICCKKR